MEGMTANNSNWQPLIRNEWIEETGISEDVKFRPREHVRDDAGHASMATTDRYIESDLNERHESGRKKRLKDIY